MKKLTFIFSLFIATAVFAAVGVWKNDKAHSQLSFEVVHLGVSNVMGTFNDFDATITSEKEDFSDAVFQLTANVGSINTRVEARDNHLKSADFFDAEKFPTLTFKSTKIESKGGKNYALTGDLTLHGVTKPVTLNLIFNGTVENPQSQKTVAGFTVTGELKRTDFGVGTKFPDAMVSDVVKIEASGEFSK